MRRASAALPLVLIASSCAGRHVALPSGAGTPFPDIATAYAEAIDGCRGVKAISATLSLSGRAGSTKLSARIDGGFAEPGRLRLEGYPRINFGGKPFFVLVATGRDATLVLTRDKRVLRADPAAIVEALAGVALPPDEMRTLVAGCGLGVGRPENGRSFQNGWAVADVAASTIFLRQVENHWRVTAVRRGPLTIEYANFSAGRPALVHLRTTGAQNAADLTIRLSQIEMNPQLNDAVFRVDVPPDAAPLTLEELRRVGPSGAPDSPFDQPSA